MRDIPTLLSCDRPSGLLGRVSHAAPVAHGDNEPCEFTTIAETADRLGVFFCVQSPGEIDERFRWNPAVRGWRSTAATGGRLAREI